VYDGAPYAGRGGWTWYRGSAAWLWRFGVERLIGVRLEGGALRLKPCLPAAWPYVHVHLRMPGGTLHITIEHDPGAAPGELEVWMDGERLPGGDTVPLPAGGREHHVVARVGAVRLDAVQP